MVETDRLAERIIKSVFFQARCMDVYEANPELVKDLEAEVKRLQYFVPEGE